MGLGRRALWVTGELGYLLEDAAAAATPATIVD